VPVDRAVLQALAAVETDGALVRLESTSEVGV